MHSRFVLMSEIISVVYILMDQMRFVKMASSHRTKLVDRRSCHRRRGETGSKSINIPQFICYSIYIATADVRARPFFALARTFFFFTIRPRPTRTYSLPTYAYLSTR